MVSSYLDHALTTPAFQPLHRTLLEESRIALTVNSKLATGKVHDDSHVQVGLNTCSHQLNLSTHYSINTSSNFCQ